MSIRNNLWAGAAMVLALSAPAMAQDASADTVVATVNGTEITLGHMITTKQGLPAQYQSLPDEVLFDGVLEQLVQQAVLAQSLNGEVPADAQLTIDNETRAILANEAVQRLLADAVTDEAVQAAYDAAYADAEPETEYHASHILVETEEEAADLVTQLEGGADFATLAQEHSTGPSGPSGGELGWFGTGVMVPAFEEVVLTLEAGTVSAPVETQFGWHVVKLNETRIKDAPALDDVRDELVAQVEQQAVGDAIATLTEAAEVTRVEAGEIDPATLSNTDLIAD